ncbi:MAG: cytoplasmic protein [Proteobacteria bacterium]|nr:cytoplasmic protein [Pseudomonadota bacterium]
MSIEQEIIDYIFDQHAVRKYYIFGERQPITLDTELTKGGLDIIWEDAQDTLDYYFKHWNVKLNEFEISKYFDSAFTGKTVETKPLYVWMLVNSAEAGEWLYD